MASPQAIAIMRATATARLDAATATLAERFGVTVTDAPLVRDPAVAQIRDQERMADLLEGVIAATEPDEKPKAAAKKPAAKDAS